MLSRLKKQILLSEPTSPLRLVDDAEGVMRASQAINLISAKTNEDQSWIVPAYNKALEFYLVGDAVRYRKYH